MYVPVSGSFHNWKNFSNENDFAMLAWIRSWLESHPLWPLSMTMVLSATSKCSGSKQSVQAFISELLKNKLIWFPIALWLSNRNDTSFLILYPEGTFDIHIPPCTVEFSSPPCEVH